MSGACGPVGCAVLFMAMYGLLFLLDEALTIMGLLVAKRLAAMVTSWEDDSTVTLMT